MSKHTLNVTELDFSEIKNNIKEYFQRQDSDFKDWDFDGSGLNTLIDVLAYNTHYNAVNAHVALNESFLDSAQVRANVVSRAKLLGYTPSSMTAAIGEVSLTFSAAANADITSVVSLGKGATFSGIVDGVTYTFVTLESYNAAASVNGTTGEIEFIFPRITIYEGRIVRRSFDVNTQVQNQKFVLADSKIDTQHMTVKVFDTRNTQISETFNRFQTFTNISSNSLVYFLYENHQEFFQIEFGDGVLGKKLNPLNIVEVEYLQTNGINANGIQSFTFTGSNPSNTSALISIATTSASGSGADREGLESIKYTAPLSFISQNRAVSASDYSAIISKDFSNLQSLSVWGGEDNVPPKFGKVLISAKPNDADTLTDAEKSRLLSLLQSKKILAIQPEIVDPEILYIYVESRFKYNSNVTSLSQGELETKVIRAIDQYNDTVLEKFEGVFRYSNFLNIIDTSDTSIMSANANVNIYKNVVFSLGNNKSLNIDFTTPIGKSASQEEPIIAGGPYIYQGNKIFIEDEANNDGVTRNLFTYIIVDGERRRLATSIGTVYPDTGLLSINPLLVDGTQSIKIRTYPRSNDIVAKRNLILEIDTAESTIVGEIDTVAVSGSSGKTRYTTFNRSY
jgi:hypothetical protein